MKSSLAEQNSFHDVVLGYGTKLVEHVREYDPDIIILVARKMPRIIDYLGLHFGNRCKIICDFAIPFCAEDFVGARVAIIDDIVNVGSTLINAYERVCPSMPKEISLFAVAARDLSPIDGLHGEWNKIRSRVNYVSEAPMTAQQHYELASAVPHVLSLLPKPFDLEFPIFICNYRLPYSSNKDIYLYLKSRFGENVTHKVSRPNYYNLGYDRITIDISTSDYLNVKARLYFDDSKKLCNLVPIYTPSYKISDKANFRYESTRDIYNYIKKVSDNSPVGSELFKGESLYRAYLFLKSLEVGYEIVGQLSEVFYVDETCPFSLEDSSLLLGRKITDYIADMQTFAKYKEHTQTHDRNKNDKYDEEVPSPFYNKFILSSKGEELLASTTVAARSSDHVELFKSFFNNLSDHVGANNHNKYDINWPYSGKEITEKPYLRLRIGPTFADLVKIFDKLWDKDRLPINSVRNLVSSFLDWAIDEGAVVPTVANYNEVFYRVYRRGEGPFRDEISRRIIYALHQYGKPISRTRLTKILSVMAYSSEVEELFSLTALERGTVAAYPATCIDKETVEITTYLRNIGLLRESI